MARDDGARKRERERDRGSEVVGFLDEMLEEDEDERRGKSVACKEDGEKRERNTGPNAFRRGGEKESAKERVRGKGATSETPGKHRPPGRGAS